MRVVPYALTAVLLWVSCTPSPGSREDGGSEPSGEGNGDGGGGGFSFPSPDAAYWTWQGESYSSNVPIQCSGKLWVVAQSINTKRQAALFSWFNGIPDSGSYECYFHPLFLDAGQVFVSTQVVPLGGQPKTQWDCTAGTITVANTNGRVAWVAPSLSMRQADGGMNVVGYLNASAACP